MNRSEYLMRRHIRRSKSSGQAGFDTDDVFRRTLYRILHRRTNHGQQPVVTSFTKRKQPSVEYHSFNIFLAAFVRFKPLNTDRHWVQRSNIVGDEHRPFAKPIGFFLSDLSDRHVWDRLEIASLTPDRISPNVVCEAKLRTVGVVSKIVRQETACDQVRNRHIGDPFARRA